ncbi:hypothetical protein TRFO_38553 [Tritrichomonas foetus]|uniref:Saposin B-type domain-containing protein n=1 Tax=Tritrichomonas foetus TaxID=1144522 RepID=A0A1J4J9J5_9EUKA|nr:hypothetical protein TRFO_38553 [Tritrichomonas foetus]|eukprot:OHS95337.1 hypothetical protein TRFO_38553 [Tritrichomonas foetus]
MILFLIFSSISINRKPIASFLNSNEPCKICQTLNLLIDSKDNINSHNILNYCDNLKSNISKMTCQIFITSYSEELSQKDFCMKQGICSNEMTNLPPVKDLLKVPRTTKSAAQLLMNKDCSICQMLAGYYIEEAPELMFSSFGSHFRKYCGTIPKFSDMCNIFTDEVLGKITKEIFDNTNSFETCVFLNYC